MVLNSNLAEKIYWSSHWQATKSLAEWTVAAKNAKKILNIIRRETKNETKGIILLLYKTKSFIAFCG